MCGFVAATGRRGGGVALVAPSPAVGSARAWTSAIGATGRSLPGGGDWFIGYGSSGLVTCTTSMEMTAEQNVSRIHTVITDPKENGDVQR